MTVAPNPNVSSLHFPDRAHIEKLIKLGNFSDTFLDTYIGEEDELYRSIALHFSIEYLPTKNLKHYQTTTDYCDLEFCVNNEVALLKTEAAYFTGIVTDPRNIQCFESIASKSRLSINFFLVSKSTISQVLKELERTVRTVDSLGVNETSKQDLNEKIILSYSQISSEINHVVKLINSTIYDALRFGASDIHFESNMLGLGIKLRIDGSLENLTSVPGVEIANQVISRLKVLGALDISESRIPQDGAFAVRFDEKDIDLRLSVMPSIHGEDVVLRILDKRSIIEAYGKLNLDALGFDSAASSLLRKVCNQDYGMLLVTGPTGSGKTTTLYAALSEIQTGKEKIITIEDPVEYQIPGILQIPVNEKKGLTFAKGLRSILRHDPDIIMVGEIRDQDTAEIAVQSALTGHLVLSTVHANNVFDVFGRFSHMGIDTYAFVSSLNGIVSQRLIRVLCGHCSFKREVSLAEIEILKNLDIPAPHEVHDALGCAECRYTGYKGRRAIAEVLPLNDELREKIIGKAPIRKIKELAYQMGATSLRHSAMALVLSGFAKPNDIFKVLSHE